MEQKSGYWVKVKNSSPKSPSADSFLGGAKDSYFIIIFKLHKQFFSLMFQEIMSLGDNNYCKNTLSVNTAASGSLMSVRFAYARALETSPEIKYQ